MANNDTVTVRLGQEELFLILMRFRMPLIVGINQQLTELSQEQLNLLMGAAEHSLLAREFIKVEPDGTPKLEPVIHAMVGACAQPEKSVVMVRTQADQKNQSMTINFARQMIVAHIPIPPGIHQFTALRNTQSVVQLILSTLGVKNEPKPGIPEGIVLESTLIQARDLAAGKKPAEAISALEKELQPASAQELVQALISPLADTTFAAINKPTTTEAQAMGGFTLLEGGQTAFLLTPKGTGDGRVISVQPANWQAIQRALETLIL